MYLLYRKDISQRVKYVVKLVPSGADNRRAVTTAHSCVRGHLESERIESTPKADTGSVERRLCGAHKREDMWSEPFSEAHGSNRDPHAQLLLLLHGLQAGEAPDVVFVGLVHFIVCWEEDLENDQGRGKQTKSRSNLPSGTQLCVPLERNTFFHKLWKERPAGTPQKRRWVRRNIQRSTASSCDTDHRYTVNAQTSDHNGGWEAFLKAATFVKLCCDE